MKSDASFTSTDDEDDILVAVDRLRHVRQRVRSGAPSAEDLPPRGRPLPAKRAEDPIRDRAAVVRLLEDEGLMPPDDDRSAGSEFGFLPMEKQAALDQMLSDWKHVEKRKPVRKQPLAPPHPNTPKTTITWDPAEDDQVLSDVGRAVLRSRLLPDLGISTPLGHFLLDEFLDSYGRVSVYKGMLRAATADDPFAQLDTLAKVEKLVDAAHRRMIRFLEAIRLLKSPAGPVTVQVQAAATQGGQVHVQVGRPRPRRKAQFLPEGRRGTA